MDTVIVSPRFQVVIPKAIRERLGELIPLQPARRLRGFLKGLDTSVSREPDRA